MKVVDHDAPRFAFCFSILLLPSFRYEDPCAARPSVLKRSQLYIISVK